MEEFIRNKLVEGRVTPRVLLSRARLMESRDWETPSINDPRYFPFYYYLGLTIQPENVLEYGFGLGLSAASFTQGCSTVKKYAGFQATNADVYYSFRLGLATLQEYFKNNVKLVSGGSTELKQVASSDLWDLVLITQKIDEKFFKDHLEMLWANLKTDALIVVDHLSNEAYKNIFVEWSSAKSREPTFYETRYIVGTVKK